MYEWVCGSPEEGSLTHTEVQNPGSCPETHYLHSVLDWRAHQAAGRVGPLGWGMWAEGRRTQGCPWEALCASPFTVAVECEVTLRDWGTRAE